MKAVARLAAAEMSSTGRSSRDSTSNAVGETIIRSIGTTAAGQRKHADSAAAAMVGDLTRPPDEPERDETNDDSGGTRGSARCGWGRGSHGTTERCATGDVFHWPPGHSVRVDRDAELILFSPQAEHTPVMDHILAKLADA